MCPAPNAHRRLEQSHRLWHQAADHYGDPPDFVTNLNALVQALRSVSLMLQSEKSSLPGFDRWYPEWQERAKQDRLMKWLNDARVQVFHVAELKTRSTVHARILLSGPVAEASFDVPVDMRGGCYPGCYPGTEKWWHDWIRTSDPVRPRQ